MATPPDDSYTGEDANQQPKSTGLGSKSRRFISSGSRNVENTPASNEILESLSMPAGHSDQVTAKKETQRMPSVKRNDKEKLNVQVRPISSSLNMPTTQSEVLTANEVPSGRGTDEYNDERSGASGFPSSPSVPSETRLEDQHALPISGERSSNERALKESDEKLSSSRRSGERKDLKKEVNAQVQARKRLKEEIETHRREKTQLLEKIRSQEEVIQTARESERTLKEKIYELETELDVLRNNGHDCQVALIAKESKLRETREQLEALQHEIESNEKTVKELEEELSEKRRIISDLELEKSNKETNKDMETKTNRNDDGIQPQMDIYNRLEETIQMLMDKNLRQEVNIQQLKKENLRFRNEKSEITERKQRYMAGKANTQDKYCHLHRWVKCSHVSLEMPTGTYISIHPSHTTSIPTVVNSLWEDIKHLHEFPLWSIPLFSLNVNAIDEWFYTIDINHEQWSKDYMVIATALTKGSGFFESKFAAFTDVQSQIAIIFCASRTYLKQVHSLTTD